MMRVRRGVLVVVVVMVVVAAGYLVSRPWFHPSLRSPKQRCARSLANLCSVITLYRTKFGDDRLLPSHLTCEGMLHILAWPELCMICPGTGRDVPQGTISTDDDVDYLYINWSVWYKDTDVEALRDYPLVYDRRLSNHGGKGINVGCMDGSTFWDAGAVWLRDFAKKHPEYEIPMPTE